MRGSSAPPRQRATIADPPDRRVQQPRIRTLSSEEVRAMTRPGATDPRLRPADRWLERWAATHGAGPILPSIASVSLVARTPSGSIPTLDDRESLLVDAVVDSSPNWARTFAVLWYRTPCTVQEIADVLHIRWRQDVYEERRTVLAYYLGRFIEIGLPVTFWVETTG
jgi:hypothetical protein